MKKTLTIFALAAASHAAAVAQTEIHTVSGDTIVVHDERTGRNETIDLPEGMTENTDSLLNEWQAKSYLRPDSSAIVGGRDAVYTPDEYRDALGRLPAVMELPYNPVVQRFIDKYTGPLGRSVGFMLGASNFYMPIFEEALDTHGLPLELRYLPVIESGLNPKAKSRVGAMGLWQFMLATGRRYGLEVTSLIDERCDPYWPRMPRPAIWPTSTSATATGASSSPPTTAARAMWTRPSRVPEASGTTGPSTPTCRPRRAAMCRPSSLRTM